MATEHTRGPWRVHATDETVILDANGDVVATTFLDGPDYEDNFERRAAHAKLIAAAPDLLALHNSAPVMSRYHGHLGFEAGRFIADYETWRVQCRTAIAKADGCS